MDERRRDEFFTHAVRIIHSSLSLTADITDWLLVSSLTMIVYNILLQLL
jgi:hypothetical protein